ncbi:MAG: SWIM zinc finger family protein [Clostridia bacterium]|nr:SWIM zinc finger family protein [Clostridia bacterium]
MFKITEEFIDSTAPNASAISNGWGLVKKSSFVKLNKSEDETLIFGECKGSGKSNYVTSVDFVKPESPVYRCTCPSRQFPCKHCLGLMYAFASGKPFETAEVPEDISSKRQKSEKREEKKKEQAESAPKKVNKSALAKKIKAQLEGLNLLEKVTLSIAKAGIGTFNSKTADTLNEQAKQLGNYYLPGAQIQLRAFIQLFNEEQNRETVYGRAVEKLTTLYALVKKGKEYLEKRLNDPQMQLDKTSTIDEWLGHAWQLSELKEMGMAQENVELLQLSFNSYTDTARNEFVDEGLWLNLSDGRIETTKNFRPFKAAKFIKEDDSFYSVVSVKTLYIYPGDLNPRVRWEEMTVKDLSEEYFDKIHSFAGTSFAEAVKTVRNQIKNPLADKNPVMLLKFTKIGMVEGLTIMEDAPGERLILEDNPFGNELASCHMLNIMEKEDLSGGSILVRFHHNMDERTLRVQPLSLVNKNSVIRFIY